MTPPASGRENTAARLLPLLGREVKTPIGPGVLVAVQGQWARVAFGPHVDWVHVASVDTDTVPRNPC
jgi:hypothetical protein